MKHGRWFLPQSPDVLGQLKEQTAPTVDGMAALVAWSQGDTDAALRLRDLEHRADELKRTLRAALSEAFTTPLEPEDIFELSRGLDTVLNGAKNTAREAELMQTAPDASIAEMAAQLLAGIQALAHSLQGARTRRTVLRPTASADVAARSPEPSRTPRIDRRCRHWSPSTTSGRLPPNASSTAGWHGRVMTCAKVAERVWYSVLKES